MRIEYLIVYLLYTNRFFLFFFFMMRFTRLALFLWLTHGVKRLEHIDFRILSNETMAKQKYSARQKKPKRLRVLRFWWSYKPPLHIITNHKSATCNNVRCTSSSFRTKKYL